MRPSELILNKDKSIYHLGLHRDHIGQTIITVGDPSRVEQVSKHLDKIIVRKSNREFVTHAGYIKDRRVTIISTGIGTDNIDIVLNEIDALVNFDLETGKVKDKLTSLDIIRIGTSGSMRTDIPCDTYVASEYSIGFDVLQHFYRYRQNESEAALDKSFKEHLLKHDLKIPYSIAASSHQVTLPGLKLLKGITITAPGFYAPQGRHLRLQPKFSNFIDGMSDFGFKGLSITNLEMETSGIYGLANLLGHRAISLNAILANRVLGTFSSTPTKTVDALIDAVISNLRS